MTDEVDAAGQRADDAPVADRARGRSATASSMNERDRPVAAAAADVEEEVPEDLACRARCARPRGGTAPRRAAGRRSRPPRAAAFAVDRTCRKPGAAARDVVAVARPDTSGSRATRGTGGSWRSADLARSRDRTRAPAAGRTRPPRPRHHQLHPVADPEHRDAELEELALDCGARRVVDGVRSAGEEDALGPRARGSPRRRRRTAATSQNTPSSRTRRAISWVYCEPKSRITTSFVRRRLIGSSVSTSASRTAPGRSERLLKVRSASRSRAGIARSSSSA